MPILKHAKKKLKQDKVRTLRNKKVKEAYKALVKQAKLDKTADSLSKAFSGVDKAAKKHIIEKNKAARLKSSLAKFVASDKTVASLTVKKAKKTASKKGAAKGKKTTTKKK